MTPESLKEYDGSTGLNSIRALALTRHQSLWMMDGQDFRGTRVIGEPVLSDR
jgi:hypothetical protein